MTDLSLVDTIVFLMMENRSFDHMLGHLSLSGSMPQVDGLHAPLDQDQYANPHDGRVYHPFEMRDGRLESDVPHNREHIPTQFAYSETSGRYEMNGFARGYFEYRPQADINITPPSLGILPAADVPISTFFAEKFAICDRWFSSLPTGTPPNKLMSLTGRSRVEDVGLGIAPSDNLVTDWLTRRNIRWRVYHDGLPFFALLGRLDVMFDRDLFRPFDRFADDVLNESDDEFPQVILIEPAYEAGPLLGGRPRNDDHAPTPVSFGQVFQRRLYEALTANAERWSKTVLIITYDEGGGFYDHVEPLEIGYAPPGNEYEAFTTTGPRVPGLVVSPLVSENRIYSENLDHSSFLQLIAERFAPGEGGYSHEVNLRADQGFRSLSDVLDLAAPRTDIPEAPAFEAPPFDSALARILPDSPIELLFDFAARKMIGESPPEAKDALPELWDWHLTAGDDPTPAEKRGIEFIGLGELFREHGGKRLEDLPQDLISADLRTPFGFTRGESPEVTVSVRAGASGTVSVFNDVDSEDPDGILAPAGEEDLERLLQPQIELDDSSVWMKYALVAELGAGVGVSLEQLGFSFDIDKKLRLTDYRRHARDNIAIGTVLSDLSSPRFALSTDHVIDLRSGECLTMQFVGTIAVGIEISWSDIFASQFGNLGALFGSDEVIPLKLSAGLTVSAAVSVEDDFLVAFSRSDRDRIRVAVRKAKRRRSNLALDASIKVTFSNPAQVEEALHAIVEGAIGAPYGEIREVLSGTIDRLSSKETRLLLLLLKALGMDPSVPDGVNELRGVLEAVDQRLDEIEARLDETIRAIASQKISVGFRYEYNRISTRASLLQATLVDEQLRAHHPDLIRGEVGGLLAAIQEGRAGIELESYLRRDRLGTARSWGFTLGIGPWSVYGRSREEVTRTVDVNENGRRRIAYNGLRSFSGKWFKESFEWSIDFRADMLRFAAGDSPKMSEFELGLALTWERRERLTEKAISKLLDAGAVWGVCSPSSYQVLRESLLASLDKECDITVQMRIDNETLRAILPRLGGAALTDLASAYGAAMPWMKDYPGRRDVNLRRALYEPLWRSYFENPDQRPDQLAARAVRHFERQRLPAKKLRVVEAQYEVRRWATFAGLAKMNSKMIADLEGFNAGMAELAAAVAEDRASSGVIETVFGRIKDVGKQSHNVRALGAYLAEVVADEAGNTRIERSVSVATRDEVHVIVAQHPAPGAPR